MRALPVAFALALTAGTAPAQTGETGPISAIDWLSHSLAQPVALAPGEAPVTEGIVTETISVR